MQKISMYILQANSCNLHTKQHDVYAVKMDNSLLLNMCVLYNAAM